MATRPAGYSGTPLAKKLGLGAGSQVVLIGEPDDFLERLEPLPQGVSFCGRVDPATDLVHMFVHRARDLGQRLADLRHAIRDDASVWVSWPKKASRVATDITENTIRELALPLGFVDIKVCAVDEVWSGLKLVIRKELRHATPASTRPRPGAGSSSGRTS